MVQFSDWKHFTSTQVELFGTDLDDDRLRSDIKKNIVIPFKEEKLLNFVVDFHFYNFAFCKEEAFDGRKTSTLMSILNDMFLFDMTTSEPSNTMSSSFNKFKSELLRHSVERPPVSIKIYDRTDVCNILKFVTNNYYRRFRLYKYVFTHKTIRQYNQVLPNEVEAPVIAPSLGLAVAIQSREEAAGDTEFDTE